MYISATYIYVPFLFILIEFVAGHGLESKSSTLTSRFSLTFTRKVLQMLLAGSFLVRYLL